MFADFKMQPLLSNETPSKSPLRYLTTLLLLSFCVAILKQGFVNRKFFASKPSEQDVGGGTVSSFVKPIISAVPLPQQLRSGPAAAPPPSPASVSTAGSSPDIRAPSLPDVADVTRPLVAMCGLDPASIDFSQERYVQADITQEKVQGALYADKEKMESMGYDVDMILIPVPQVDQGFEIGVNAFSAKRYDAIMIGAGVRKNDDMFLLFEKLVNAAHQAAPQAKICFNTGPFDSSDAVKRWVPLSQYI